MHRYHFDGMYLQLYLEFFSAQVIWSGEKGAFDKGFAKEIWSEGGFGKGLAQKSSLKKGCIKGFMSIFYLWDFSGIGFGPKLFPSTCKT